jgi:hypothetical protein
VGRLDQLAKQTFAEETELVTRGAFAWQIPPEIGLFEVRGDGLLLVRDSAAVASLSAPWVFAGVHDEILVELKMQGDHLDQHAIERALLRRQVRQVQRLEQSASAWRGAEPLWMIAPNVPEVLAQVHEVTILAPGCYRVGPSSFTFLWIAANELPLRDDLIPFLVARSGRALDEFARWVSAHRSAEWLLRMLQILPMSTSVREELLRYIPQTDDPEIRARQRHITEVLVDLNPEVRNKLVKEGIKQGLEMAMSHMAERRLGRPLQQAEQAMLAQRLERLGAARVEDVILSFSADALAAWLADPSAS